MLLEAFVDAVQRGEDGDLDYYMGYHNYPTPMAAPAINQGFRSQWPDRREARSNLDPAIKLGGKLMQDNP